MQFFIDTANLDEIRKAKEWGLVDGVTTNPSLMAKEGGDWRKQAQAICKEVEGPVSLEVIAENARGMVEEAMDLVKFGSNVVVKIPMTLEGMQAVRELSSRDVATNVTLVFSPLQALLAAKAGATYVSPFVGRLDDISQPGMELIQDIITIYSNYGFDTQVLVASVRNPVHVLEAALMGADVSTIPFAVIKQFASHPLTDAGLAKFLEDWKKLP